MAETEKVRHLPAPIGPGRVETGSVQFGDDWPGLFIRGDEAFHLMLLIRELTEKLAGGHSYADAVNIVRQLAGFADMIDKDVIVR